MPCPQHEQMVKDVTIALSKPNGFVKWWQLWTIAFGLLGTVVTITLSVTGRMADAVAQTEKDSMLRDREITKCISDYVIPMKEDIASIKTALGIKNQNDRK